MRYAAEEGRCNKETENDQKAALVKRKNQDPAAAKAAILLWDAIFKERLLQLA
jgi:hypothetical protein